MHLEFAMKKSKRVHTYIAVSTHQDVGFLRTVFTVCATGEVVENVIFVYIYKWMSSIDEIYILQSRH